MNIGSGPYIRGLKGQLKPLNLTQGELPKTLEAAYAALARNASVQPGAWGAWKLGGTNSASREVFKVNSLYYGAVAQSEILLQPSISPGFELPELKGEAEIALRINSADDGYDAWCIALEMPASAVHDLSDLGVVALVADRCATGALVLGPCQTTPLPSPSDLCLGQRINGVLRDQNIATILLGHPAEILADFLKLAHGHGAPVRPGHWVATGGVTSCLAYSEGDQVEILLNDRKMIETRISTRAS